MLSILRLVSSETMQRYPVVSITTTTITASRVPGTEPSNKSEELSAGPPFDPAIAANILHLSDLHFGADSTADAKRWYTQLAYDLCNELGCKRIHVVIISGDIGNFSTTAEYQAARVFLKRICEKFERRTTSLTLPEPRHHQSAGFSSNWRQ
jgi:hypothetical protein